MKKSINEFAEIILAIVLEIPHGKVASYKQLAILSGYPRNARQVGKILANADYFGDYPCHRVVHENGELVAFWREQKDRLLNEGIEIIKNKVNMLKHKW